MNKDKVKQSFIQRAKVLAHVMTSSKNIEVTVSGTNAYRQPGLINIPNGNFMDPEWCKMVKGWIDHELGHEDETDHTVTANTARECKVLNDFRNIIEDCRMEKSRGEKYRGCRNNLTELSRLAMERDLFPDPSDLPSGSLPAMTVLYIGRHEVIGQTCLSDYAYRAKLKLGELLPNLNLDDLRNIILKTNDAQSNADSVSIAREILDLLKDSIDNNSDDSQDDSDRSDDSQDDSGSSDDSPGDSDLSGAVKKFLDDMANAEIGDFHEELSKLLSEDSDQDEDITDSGLDVPVTMVKRSYASLDSKFDSAKAKSLSASIYQTLHKVLFDQQENLERPRKVGSRILKRKLSGIPGGNLSVFKQHVEQQELTAAVSIVVDASPSMRKLTSEGEKQQQAGLPSSQRENVMDVTNASVFALSNALQRGNIPNEILYYGWRDSTDGPHSYYVAKSYNDRASVNALRVSAANYSTPTGDAMLEALNRIVLRTEDKKLMFVLTDGQPDDVQRVSQASKLCSLFGVKVIPIGICTSAVNGFNDNEFVVVDELNKLPAAIREAVKLKLFA